MSIDCLKDSLGISVIASLFFCLPFQIRSFVRWEPIESRRETPRRLSIGYVLKCFPLPAGKKQINSEDNWPMNAKPRRNFSENSTDRIVILCRKSCLQRLQDQEQYNRVHSDARPNVRNKSGCPDEPRLTVSVLRERR